MNNSLAGSERVRCRHPKCRSKLFTPTSNHHKAFCTADCHRRFYKRKCIVCEKPLPEGHRRQLCSARKCRLDYRNFRPSYVLGLPPEPKCKSDSKSPCGTGTKNGIKDPGAYRIIAGPALPEFALWAATHEPPKSPPTNKPAWHLQRQPGDLAAEWTARELARREAEDAKYVAEDEERLRAEGAAP